MSGICYRQAAISLVCMIAITQTACSSPSPKAATFQPAASSVNATSHSAVAVAKKMIGKPYRYGGASPEKGFDCSGLVYYAFRHAGIKVPRSSHKQFVDAFPVNPHALRQGDLLFFMISGKISHVGIYIGNNTFIHAPSSGKEVAYASLNNPYWRDHLIKAGRLY